jgi:hypothetical protein
MFIDRGVAGLPPSAGGLCVMGFVINEFVRETRLERYTHGPPAEGSGVWTFVLSKSHQRSWWIVHTRPTREPWSVLFPNPTNAVGGLFIPRLQPCLAAGTFDVG